MQHLKLIFSIILIALAACSRQAVDTSPLVIESINFGSTKIVDYQANVEKGTIQITVPYGVNIQKLKPILKLSEGGSSVPASGIEQDFSKPIVYTLTGAGGNKAIFIVSVTAQAAVPPLITNIDRDTVEAGQTLTLTGKNFGSFDIGFKTAMINTATQQSIDIAYGIIDSAKIFIKLPFDFVPAKYKISLTNKNLVGVTDKPIVVQYPTPQITEVSGQNLRQGDTLWLTGNYIKTSAYQYEAQLSNIQKTYNLALLKSDAQKLIFIVPNTLLPNEYKVKLLNVSEKKQSQEAAVSVQVYDKTKPFLGTIVNKQASYQPQQTLVVNTYNFDQTTARFYQCQLYNNSGSYFQNGIYDATKQRLSITLPTGIKSGQYQVSMRFLATDGTTLYEIKTDEKITLN